MSGTTILILLSMPTTQQYITPFELIFGLKAILPIDIEVDERATENIIFRCSKHNNVLVMKKNTERRTENLQKAGANIERAKKNERNIQ